MGKGFVVVYVVLLWLRWMMASLPGYIHPDEFFQSPEITARAVLKVDTLIPWEFQSDYAARSILIPFLTTGLPFWLMTLVQRWMEVATEVPQALTLFLVERSAGFGLTLITDYVVYQICQRMGKDHTLPLLFVATSQVTLVYNTRPFSNAIEALVLSLSLLSLVRYDQLRSSAFELGCLLCVGIFTRITFFLYGFPIGLAFLYLAKRQGRLIQSMVVFLLGASMVAGVMVVADSLYYGSLAVVWPMQPFQSSSLLSLRWEGELTWTVWNNLMYNLKVENLALHGLHPRYTHILVNFPLLFGPLAVMAIWAFVASMNKAREEESPGYLFYVMAGIVVNAMIGLSLMPHQEARFLVPMLVPLVMVYTWDQDSSIGSLPFMLLWCAFNLITSFIFGNVHQAGIVPTMSFVQRQSMGINGCALLDSGYLTCDLVPVGGPIVSNGFNLTTHVIFHKTYMPPQHLLAFPLAWKDGPVKVSIEDVAGDKSKLYDALKDRQGITYRKHGKDRLQVEFASSKEAPGTYERTILVCPNVTPLPDIPGQRYMLISSYTPHVNFDHLGDMFELAKKYDSPINLASLNVFAILSDDDE